MRVLESVHHDDLSGVEAVAPAPFYTMGQTGPIEDALTKLKTFLAEKALYLVAIGAAIGIVGNLLFQGGPLEQLVTVAGGVILAAGILPLILGAMA